MIHILEIWLAFFWEKTVLLSAIGPIIVARWWAPAVAAERRCCYWLSGVLGGKSQSLQRGVSCFAFCCFSIGFRPPRLDIEFVSKEREGERGRGRCTWFHRQTGRIRTPERAMARPCSGNIRHGKAAMWVLLSFLGGEFRVFFLFSFVINVGSLGMMGSTDVKIFPMKLGWYF